jgi:hypothetical protein
VAVAYLLLIPYAAIKNGSMEIALATLARLRWQPK